MKGEKERPASTMKQVGAAADSISILRMKATVTLLLHLITSKQAKMLTVKLRRCGPLWALGTPEIDKTCGQLFLVLKHWSFTSITSWSLMFTSMFTRLSMFLITGHILSSTSLGNTHAKEIIDIVFNRSVNWWRRTYKQITCRRIQHVGEHKT